MKPYRFTALDAPSLRQAVLFENEKAPALEALRLSKHSSLLSAG